jgi:hypothetical protein
VAGREALLRYVLRPPIAQERLERRPDGLVRIALKRTYADGTIAVEMDPLSLLGFLASFQGMEVALIWLMTHLQAYVPVMLLALGTVSVPLGACSSGTTAMPGSGGEGPADAGAQDAHHEGVTSGGSASTGGAGNGGAAGLGGAPGGGGASAGSGGLGGRNGAAGNGTGGIGGSVGTGGCPNGNIGIAAHWTGSGFSVPDNTPVHGFIFSNGVGSTQMDAKDTQVLGGTFALSLGKTSLTCSVAGPVGAYTLLYIDVDNSGTCSRTTDDVWIASIFEPGPTATELTVSPTSGPRLDPMNSAQSMAVAQKCGP